MALKSEKHKTNPDVLATLSREGFTNSLNNVI